MKNFYLKLRFSTRVFIQLLALRQFNVEIFREITILLQLGVPLVLSGLIESSPRYFNTLFFAKLNSHEFAAGAIVSWLFGTLMCVFWGIFTAVSLLVAHERGAKNKLGMTIILHDSLILAVLLGLIMFVVLRHMAPFLILLGQDPTIISSADAYLHALSWSALPNFVNLVILQFLSGLGHTRVNLVFSLFWVPLNILCCYTLVLGKFGFPAYGIAGMGWGTTIVYTILAIGMFSYIRTHSYYKIYLQHFFSTKLLVVWEILRIGLPMGLMFSVETAFFLVFNLLMEHEGIHALTANQITLQYMSLFNAVIFSFAQAVSIRIGHELGKQQLHRILFVSYTAIFFTLLISGILAACIWIFHLQLINLDIDVTHSKDQVVVSYAARFMKISTLFMLCETVRLILFASLRSLKETPYALFSLVVSYYVIAMPVGYLLATEFKLAGTGLWVGMILGSICGSIFLFFRLHSKNILAYLNSANLLVESH